jgi:proline iminopeptidase
MKSKRFVFFVLAVGTLLAAVCCAGTAFAQQSSQPPKPSLEHQKLQLWFGEWTYEGENQATFLGPGGKFTGRMTGRPIMDGFGAEYVFVENGPGGEVRTVEIDTYDPVAKNFPYICVSSDGSLYQGSFTMNGNVATWDGTYVAGGKRGWERGTDAVAPDGKSFIKKGEISVDGKTWVPSSSLKATKVKAAESPRSSGVVMVRGTALPYLTQGSGIPCLVTGYSTLYEAVFSDELKKHFQFIFVDWKNSFTADDPFPPAGMIAMETLVDDLDEVRRQLGHEKIAILGHSWPGFLPLAYGKKYPSHASHLIIIGCPPYANRITDKTSAEFWEQDASPERKAVHRRNLEASPNSLLDKLGPRERWVMQYVRDRAMCWANPTYDSYWLWLGKGASMDFEHQYYSVLTADFDPTPYFGEITPPVFLALGRYDYWAPPELWDAVKEKLPNLSYHLFQKSGHWPMLEEQELFDRKLINWLQGAKR